MLKKLEFCNFKPWEKLDLDFGRVTGLFGTNSSGKSSIIQFLLMLKQTKNATDRGLVLDLGGPDQFINLGTFQDMVHHHNIEKVMRWNLSWRREDELRIPNSEGKQKDALFSGYDISSSCQVVQNRGAMKARNLSYKFDGTACSLSRSGPSRSEFELTPRARPKGSALTARRPQAPKQRRSTALGRSTGRR